MLERAMAYSQGRMTLAVLRQLHLDQRVQVWVVLEDGVIRAAAASEVVNFPTGRRVLRVFLAGGAGLHLAKPAMELMARYGRSWGCASIEAEGRRGWGRVLPGFREVWRTFERELFDA